MTRHDKTQPCGKCGTTLQADEQVRPRARDSDQRILCLECSRASHTQGSAHSSPAVVPFSGESGKDYVARVLGLLQPPAPNTARPAQQARHVPLTRESVADELERLMDPAGAWQAPALVARQARVPSEAEQAAVALELARLLDGPRPEAGAAEVAGELERLIGPPPVPSRSEVFA